jgi:hypothetical protein
MTNLVIKQSLNQLSQLLSRGCVSEEGGLYSVEGVLANTNPTQVTSAGDLVKLVIDNNGIGRCFAEVNENDTTAYGFVKMSLRTTSYRNSDEIAVARNYDVICSIAKNDIEAGDKVYYITTPDSVSPSDNFRGYVTNEQPDGVTEFGIPCGFAITKANAGKIVQIEIRLPEEVIIKNDAGGGDDSGTGDTTGDNV